MDENVYAGCETMLLAKEKPGRVVRVNTKKNQRRIGVVERLRRGTKLGYSAVPRKLRGVMQGSLRSCHPRPVSPQIPAFIALNVCEAGLPARVLSERLTT